MSAARFTVLDEASTAQLLDRLTLDVLLQASAAPDSALGKALAAAIVVAADQTFKDVVGDAIRERDAIDAWIERAGGIEQAIAELSQSFGLDPDDTPRRSSRNIFAASLIPEAEWPALIEVLDAGSANDKKHIAALQAARSGHRPRAHRRLSGSFLHRRTGRRAKTSSPRSSPIAIPPGSRACRPSRRASAPCSTASARLTRATAPRALVTIAKEVIDRYAPRERAARAARLRRPDRQDAGAV